MAGYANHDVAGAFESSRAVFESIITELGAADCGITHGELEELLTERSRKLMRRLLQEHLDLRSVREHPVPGGVTGPDGIQRTRLEQGRRRGLATVFGEVTVTRLAYRAPSASTVHPADGVLNLPAEKHSHGLRRLAALEAARGSFGDAQAAISRATGQEVGKRQLQQLAARAATDFETFYETRRSPAGTSGDVLVLSADGKGIVMHPEALREATRKKAAESVRKLGTRLSKGEKRNRTRMAEVGSVYDITPAARTAADILALTSETTSAEEITPAPVARNKWLTASVTTNAAGVLTAVFDEATRRDPTHQRQWIALVDGNNDQLRRIRTEARTREVKVTILIDVIHVLEYLWKAAWCLHDEGDPAAETWVGEQARRILDGHAPRRRRHHRHHHRHTRRPDPDPTQKRRSHGHLPHPQSPSGYLDYPTALKNGWHIATGIIEGACRHLIADRMDITGARWKLPSAEAILQLRALHANGDFNDYWTYHLTQEQQRNHPTHNAIPQAA
ncbi:ISKra4 family transposase [Saccharopolyspora spinosa]|uniref:ISKra4 family transposase n=1 Tax=Saccharopolyspora spinosa TaxID=60894 RepID=UPI0037482AAF